ncbi:TPA: nucleotide exchange factor GrpE [Patescibacteria group bacterium]|nr:MAG: Protein GrpE [Parcubacteria group bacterium GW2011_GWD2_42_14]HCC05664.1 nucleotide exchange factor GrpE [Patescibacteria group bacterium]
MKKRAENEEISIDLESGDEIVPEEEEVSNSALKAKLKELRKELLATQKERDENLAGWQRAKADLVNYRKNVNEDAMRDKRRAKASVIASILPAVDSFTSAMDDPSWKDVDANWRNGVERIASQLTQALASVGLTAFGKVGEPFNPSIHECMSIVPTSVEKEDHTIAQVLQQGYMIEQELVRPAKVVVAQVQEKE